MSPAGCDLQQERKKEHHAYVINHTRNSFKEGEATYQREGRPAKSIPPEVSVAAVAASFVGTDSAAVVAAEAHNQKTAELCDLEGLDMQAVCFVVVIGGPVR